jgi:hypothetical protein
VRGSLPDELTAYLDGEGRADLGRDLRVLRDGAATYGFACAVRAMRECLGATGGIDRPTVDLAAARISSGDARVDYDEDVDLGVYDRALRLVEGGDGNAA